MSATVAVERIKSVFLLDRARPVFFGKIKENGGRILRGKAALFAKR